MSTEKLKRKAATLAVKYSNDISSEDLTQEINHITMGPNANFLRKQLSALKFRCIGRVQIRKYISHHQCQFEDVPYSHSSNSG